MCTGRHHEKTVTYNEIRAEERVRGIERRRHGIADGDFPEDLLFSLANVSVQMT